MPCHGDFLLGDPRWQRAWLRNRWTSRCSLGWRWAFYLVTPPGLLLGLLCFWQRDPRVAADHLAQKSPRRSVRDYLNLFRTRSYLINCIAMTLMTFVTGGLGFWVPAYLRYRDQSPAVGMTIFGLITVVAGLVSTLLGA